MCACEEPVGTAIGAVCVEYGRPKWPITMLNHTDIPGTEICFYFLVQPAMKRLFCLKEKTSTVASLPRPLPHYYTAVILEDTWYVTVLLEVPGRNDSHISTKYVSNATQCYAKQLAYVITNPTVAATRKRKITCPS